MMSHPVFRLCATIGCVATITPEDYFALHAKKHPQLTRVFAAPT
jgi:hypothetical protein